MKNNNNRKRSPARTVTAEITDMSNLGFGIAHADGKTLFIQHGVDGDTVEAKVIKECSDYDVARIERIISPSPFREEHPCPVSGRCGGCTYVGITREHELELKRRTVGSTMRKAGLGGLNVAPVLAAPERYGYRNKLQLPIAVGKDGKAIMGYYAPRSHEIIPCTDCLLQSPVMSGIATWLCEQIGRRGITGARHLFMRSGTDSRGEVSLAVCLVSESRPKEIEKLADELLSSFPSVTGFLLNYNTADTNVILGERYELIRGTEYVTDCLCGVDFRISPASFYQVNRGGAELAYRHIAELAGIRSGDRVLDLYCGIGSIGLSVTSGINDVSLTGIEIVPAAVENAVYNAERAGFRVLEREELASASGRRAAYICGDAGNAEPGDYDVIIVDPPRKGCSPELIERLAELAQSARALVYMSCNPQTLARDLSLLRDRGITVRGDITPIDMFPGTGHVECIVLMSKTEQTSSENG